LPAQLASGGSDVAPADVKPNMCAMADPPRIVAHRLMNHRLVRCMIAMTFRLVPMPGEPR
jgi:hypothetical protein